MSDENNEEQPPVWREVYLYTHSHYGSKGPSDHGLVRMRDGRWVDDGEGGETPVEDFGMWFCGAEPFEGDVSKAFYDLLFDTYNKPTTCWGSANYGYKPDWKLSETPIGKYLKIESA